MFFFKAQLTILFTLVIHYGYQPWFLTIAGGKYSIDVDQ
jgi:hypothetical protein